MSNVLELTSVLVKSKRLERISGRIASKVRFTPATVISLRKNLETDAIQKSVQKYNSTYSDLRNAVVSAEVAAAEQEARDKALSDSKTQKAEELRNASIEEDNLVAKITSAEVAKPRFTRLKIGVQKLRGKFGTLGKNYGVNVKKGFVPKALSVPKVYSKTYRVILKNAELYKLASQVAASNPELMQVSSQHVSSANWKNLFDNVDSKRNDEINVAMGGVVDTEEEFVPVESKGVSQEELSHRRMIGQLGDELQEIRKLQMSSNGVTSPFSNGLNEREDSLLSMLSNLSGVDSIAQRKVVNLPRKDNTDFQNLIEQIVGYKDPVTDEEHNKEQARLQEYYSNPEVSEIIDNLRHKDVLFSFNQPEAYEKVMAAERIDNERKAAETIAIDLLDSDDIEEDEIKAKEEKEALIDGAKEQAELLQQENEKIELIDAAEEQAHMIQQEEERANIIVGAEEQARILQEQNERIDLLQGAEEQARMLKTLNDFIDKQNELEQSAKAEEERIANEKKEKERALKEQAERAEIVKGAKEQAKQLQKSNERADILNSAETQARILQAGNEYIELIDGASEQAKMLQQKNEQVNLVSGAEEQAQLLNDIPEDVDMMEKLADQIVYQNTTDDHVYEGAEEQARLLQEQNERADIINGAEEQANMLQQKNEMVEIMDSAEEQAQMLHANNIRIDLTNGAEEQAKMLYQKEREQQQSVNMFKSFGFEILNNDDRYGNIVSTSKPIKLRQIQMSNITKRLNGPSKSTSEKKKELLSSLKDQLSSPDFDFLKYNSDVVNMAKVA